MDTIEALESARRNGSAGPVILVNCDNGLVSAAYMALRDDPRVKNLGNGPAPYGFIVPIDLWDEMLMQLKED